MGPTPALRLVTHDVPVTSSQDSVAKGHVWRWLRRNGSLICRRPTDADLLKSDDNSKKNVRTVAEEDNEKGKAENNENVRTQYGPGKVKE